MQFTDLGFFTTYEPEGENPDGIIFFRNEADQDFYDLVRQNSDRGHWFMAGVDGNITAVSADLSGLSPFNARVIHVDDGAALADDFRTRAATGDPLHRLIWDGAEIRPYQPAPAEIHAERRQAVNRERERRLAAGKPFAVSWQAEPIPMTGRPFDQTVILGLVQRATALHMQGVTEAAITFRDAANTTHHLTPAQFLELGQAGTNWVEAVMTASWALKDSGSIPEDFADDTYWPA